MKRLKAKKLLTLSLTAAMAMSMAACGGKDAGTSAEPSNANAQTADTEAAQQESTPEAETTPAEDAQAEAAPAGEVSIDFEDGVYGFAGVDKSVNPAGDDAALSVADFAGSKALKVETNGKAPYVGFQVDALLGDKAADVRTVEMSLGIENPDGKFNAVSGKIYAFLGAEKERKDGDWSVYLETANPKTAVYELPDDMAFGEEITWCCPLRRTMARMREKPLRFCILITLRSRMHQEMSLRQILRQSLCQPLQGTTVRTLQASRGQWILKALRQRETAGHRAALP